MTRAPGAAGRITVPPVAPGRFTENDEVSHVA